MSGITNRRITSDAHVQAALRVAALASALAEREAL
jgi:hypothetical protein